MQLFQQNLSIFGQKGGTIRVGTIFTSTGDTLTQNVSRRKITPSLSIAQHQLWDGLWSSLF